LTFQHNNDNNVENGHFNLSVGISEINDSVWVLYFILYVFSRDLKTLKELFFMEKEKVNQRRANSH
jgi:hypothetical protein